jgi:DNA-binding Xre family transcriptional regulator
MSNYATGGEGYIAAIADYYGSIESNLEAVAISRGFVTRNNTVNINKLADASDVSTSTLWYLLKDKRHFRSFNLVTLSKLCHALQCQPADLLRYVPGGSSRGLGYSSEAFLGLRGTQNGRTAQVNDVPADQASDGAGSEEGEERPFLSDAA